MTRYHVRADGSMGVCTAKEGNCPFGAEEGTRHFTSKTEAQRYSEGRIKERASTGGSLRKQVDAQTPEAFRNLSSHTPSTHVKLDESGFAVPSEHFYLTEKDFSRMTAEDGLWSPGVLIQKRRVGFTAYDTPMYDRCLYGSYINNSQNDPVVYITGRFMKSGKFKTNATGSDTVLLLKSPGPRLGVGEGRGDHTDDDVAEQTAEFLKSGSPEAREMLGQLPDVKDDVEDLNVIVIDDLGSFNRDWRKDKE